MDLDISNILHDINIRNNTIQDNSAVVKDLEARRNSSEEDMITLAMSATDAHGETPLSIQTKMLAGLQTQQNISQAATVLGTNLNAKNEVLTGLSTELLKSSDQAIAAKKKVADKSSVSLFDNPIEYLVNQMTIGDDINAADAASSYADSIKSKIDNITNSTDRIAQTQRNIEISQNAASIDSVTKGVQANISLQSKQIEANNLLHNVAGIQAINQMSEQQLQNSISGFNAIMSVKSQQLAQARTAQESVNADLQRQILQQNLDEKKATAEQLGQYVQLVQTGAAVTGYKGDLNPGRIALSLKTNDPLFAELYKQGLQYSSTGNKLIAPTTGETARKLIQFKFPLSDAARPVGQALTDLYTNTYSEIVSGRMPGVDTKDVNGIDGAASKVIQAKTAEWMKNVDPANQSNPYAFPPLSAVVKTVPALANNQVFKTVIGPMLSSGALINNDPNQIIVAIANKVGTGKDDISFEAARNAVLTYVAASAQTNNMTKQFSQFGLPEQKAVIGLQVPGKFYGTNTYNIADPSDVGRLIIDNKFTATAKRQAQIDSEDARVGQ